jgi:hypothetical protein
MRRGLLIAVPDGPYLDIEPGSSPNRSLGIQRRRRIANYARYHINQKAGERFGLASVSAASVHAQRLRRLIPTLRVFHHSSSRLRYRIAMGPHAGRKALTASAPRGPPDSQPVLSLT